jgi:hypothetical protein
MLSSLVLLTESVLFYILFEGIIIRLVLLTESVLFLTEKYFI